jgi:hypothetical protein
MPSPKALYIRCRGVHPDEVSDSSGSYKSDLQLNDLERSTIEGDSPVSETDQTSWDEYPSTAGHVEPRGNLGGPSPKAKYYLTTDSELVP